MGTEDLSAEVQSLLREYVGFLFESDPIEATRLGVHDHGHRLGEVSSEAMADMARQRQGFLSRFVAVPPQLLDAETRLDLRLAAIDAETWLRRYQDLRVWERAPYWYIERLGSAFADLIGREFAPPQVRAEALLSRLGGTPQYLAAAQRNLQGARPTHAGDNVPAIWVEMGVMAGRGLQQFLETAVPGFAATLPSRLRSLALNLHQAQAAASAALSDFLSFLQELHGRVRGHFPCGVEHFDFLLQSFHLLDMDHRSLYEFGLERVAADRARLEAFACEQDPSRSWVEQLEQIKLDHPRGDEFLDVYRREMTLVREHCVEQDLITLPAGEHCWVDWLPAYLRAGAPMGLMNTSPPFEPSLDGSLLITPVDLDAPPERQLEHMRDNNYAFVRSITLHEIYPGHHVQQLHHKLATQSSPMRRAFSSPVLIEGWGLYTEDLLAETGFLREPAVQLFKLRNALWRSVRVVIDTGLHTRGMTFEEAVGLLRDLVRQDQHMAEGEVRRYTAHDSPTYTSSYLVGKVLIQDLRERWRHVQGPSFRLKTFHDWLLSFGSPPVKLIAERYVEDAT